MTCKCGSEMRLQSRGVWFCFTGDRFAVRLLGPTADEMQWYWQEGRSVEIAKGPETFGTYAGERTR